MLCFAKIVKIKELLLHPPHVTIFYEHRQTNRVAHFLASHGFESFVDQFWFSHAPDFIRNDLAYDYNYR